MTIDKIQDNGILTFTIKGRIDTTTAPQLQEALIPAFDEEKDVKLDFGKVAINGCKQKNLRRNTQ